MNVGWHWRAPVHNAVEITRNTCRYYFYGLTIGRIGLGVLRQILITDGGRE